MPYYRRTARQEKNATPRHLTAIARTDLSRPVRCAIEDGVLAPEQTVLDYGCGRGGDVRVLVDRGFNATGWDPAYTPTSSKTPADVVNLGYVVNVIERPAERVAVLRDAWSLAKRLLVVAARLEADAPDHGKLQAYEDGFLTAAGTFQKFYAQSELRDWIGAVLDRPVVSAAPGIVYVFRDDTAREAYVASRIRQRLVAPRPRVSDLLFEKHRDLLERLMEFFADRGRLPIRAEFGDFDEVESKLGSVRRAFQVIRRTSTQEYWDRVRDRRSQDLLVYVALSRFARRPRFGELPLDLRQDVKAFFANYTRACSLADLLLFTAGVADKREAAFRASTVGKLMPTALYIHESSLSDLPTVLRVYEGCGRSYLGRVDGANVIKLHRDQPRISYLSYPDFEDTAHPELTSSLSVHLQTFAIDRRTYDGDNRPVLHRKEDFVSTNHPLRLRFERLTKQEERFGLFTDPSRIGLNRNWVKLLYDRGLSIRGHRVVRLRKKSAS